MPATKFFFLGFPIDDRLEEGLAQCKPSDKTFLENPKYLEQLSIEGERYVGRRMEDVISAVEVDDAARNVRSLISRLVSGWTTPLSAASLLAVEEDQAGQDTCIS